MESPNTQKPGSPEGEAGQESDNSLRGSGHAGQHSEPEHEATAGFQPSRKGSSGQGTGELTDQEDEELDIHLEDDVERAEEELTAESGEADTQKPA
jgi:hypothetical protein